MRIGIIGAGNIGGTLARRLTALGHEVSIANSRGPETLAGLAKETGAKPVTAREAARAGEVVIVTIPQKNVPRLPADLFDGVPSDVVVVDTNNYYPQQRDGRIDAIEKGTTESRWVSDTLRRPVVKAFNNIYARHLLELGKPKGAAGRIALPVAGDDPRAKEVVIRLVEELGFDGLDAGNAGRVLAAAAGDAGLHHRSRRGGSPARAGGGQAGASAGVSSEGRFGLLTDPGAVAIVVAARAPEDHEMTPPRRPFLRVLTDWFPPVPADPQTTPARIRRTGRAPA